MLIIIAYDSWYTLIVKMLYFVFNFVLTTYKGILKKISVREIQIGLLELMEHES